MANPLTQNTQIFLGINGEQSGPHTENEIVDRIRGGTVPADALIWFEGLQEWQSVQTIPSFGGAFSGGAAEAPPPPAAASTGFKPLSASTTAAATPKYKMQASSQATDDVSTFAQGAAEPVFKVERSKASYLKPSKAVIAIVLTVLAGCGGVVYYLFVLNAPTEIKAKVRPKFAAPPSRESQLSAALSELLLNPAPSLDTLKQLIGGNATDEVGKQAITAAVDYYRLHAPPEAGRLLMLAKRPDEAVKYFLIDPPQYDEAEKALSGAIEIVKDPVKKRKLIIQDIDILLDRLNQRPKAIEKIKLLEQSYPGEGNPYAYYLKSNDEKIRDIFNRISFYFVKSLLGVFETEMPQINLVARPLIELRKDKENKYRVVGVYKGDIVLNHDHLSNITFQFWLDKEHWILVDTNLTSERQKWASGEKLRLKNTALAPAEMLRDLETTFRTQFPQNGLHENVNKPKPPPPE